jgi:hypothetical protein
MVKKFDISLFFTLSPRREGEREREREGGW